MKTARDIAKNVNNGSSATLELEETLVRIKEQNDELNVFLYVDEQGARAAAQRVDEIVARGENAGPLAGVPIALKDNLCTVDVKDLGWVASALQRHSGGEDLGRRCGARWQDESGRIRDGFFNGELCIWTNEKSA